MGAGTAQRGACLLISGKVRNNMEFVVFTGVLLFIFLFMIVQELMQAKKEEKPKIRTVQISKKELMSK